MEYELTTIKDIFDKVPTDRIGACMHELTAMLMQSAALRDIIKHAAAGEGVHADEAFSFPELLTWTDDGKGNIDLTLSSTENDQELLTVRTKLSVES